MERKDNRKKPENCFRCWHARRVDGTSAFCICVFNMTKTNPPELILEPYRGKCLAFYDKTLIERECCSSDGELD